MSAIQSVGNNLPQGSFREGVPYIDLVCNGLLALTYNAQQPYVDISVLSQVENHFPNIQIVTRTIATSHLSAEGVSFTEDLELRVIGGMEGKSVFYLNDKNGTLFSRSRTDDEKDFRWILDLEGDLFYKGRLPRKPGVLTPTLRVHEGLFYTMCLTPGDFEIVDDKNNRVALAGRISVSMAARLHLSSVHSIVTIGNRVITAPGPGEEKLILVQNDCPVCWDPGEIDFNLFFNAVDLTGQPVRRLRGPLNSSNNKSPCNQSGFSGG